MKDKQKLLAILFVIWCTGLAIWLYGPVLELPFFFDDFVERPYIQSLTLAQIWQTAGDLAYFRPLLFTIWKTITFLPGSPSPALDHALNLLFFIADAILVGWLARKLWSAGTAAIPGSLINWLRPFLAATFFLFFPFNYQAVPWLGSLSHILSTFLILATIAAYWQWRINGRWQTRNGRLWVVLSLFLALLTPFAHENGILLPLILALYLTFDAPKGTTFTQKITGAFPNVLPWFIPTLIWLPIWWAAPKAVTSTIQLQSGETLFQNTIYFLQAIAYPFTWFGGWLRETAAINDLLVAGGLSFLGLTIAALILWRGKADRRILFPLAWMIIASVPTILLLRFDYIINGPRLLLLAGVGAVWLWTEVILAIISPTFNHAKTAVKDKIPHSWPRLIIAAGLLLILLLQNGRFLRERMQTHQMLGSVYHDIVDLSSQVNQRGQAAAFINLPSWITPGTLTYAVGHEGVQFWPDYAQPHTLASITTGQSAQITLVRKEAIRPQMPYFYGLSGGSPIWPELAAAHSAVFVTDYQPEEITIRAVGSFAVPQSNGDPLALFNKGQIILETAKAAQSETGTTVRLTLRVVEPPPDSLTIFVHVIDISGQLLIQADGDPFAGTFPLAHWPAGQTAEDQRYIPITGDDLQILIGLYDRTTGLRWTAETPTNQPLPDNALPLPITK